MGVSIITIGCGGREKTLLKKKLTRKSGSRPRFDKFDFARYYVYRKQYTHILKGNTEVMTKILPALVYGTLRPGQHNYATFLEGTTTKETTVRVNGFRMYGGSGFPYVTEGEATDSIVAELVYIDPEVYDLVLHRLDFLEGYRGEDTSNHYDRITATVEVDGEMVEAWIYVAGDYAKGQLHQLPVVEHGDWIQFDTVHNTIWNSQLHV